MSADLILRTSAGGTNNTVKNSPLTYEELDQNFINLDNEIDVKANASNAILTGVPTALTAPVGTNTTQIATTAFVQTARAEAGSVDLGQNVIAGVLPLSNGGTGLSSPGSVGFLLTSNGANWIASSVYQIAVTAGSVNQSFVGYNGITKTLGQFDGGTTDPTNTTRLNYDGHFYATKFYGDGSALTGIAVGSSGATIVNDTTTNAVRYPLFEDVTSGILTTVGTSNTKLTFNPSTGVLSATGFSGSGASLTQIPTSGISSGTFQVSRGGTGVQDFTGGYRMIFSGTSGTGNFQSIAAGLTTQVLVGGGASTLPVWTTATGSGSPVRGTSPTITSPTITSATLTSCTLTTAVLGTPTSGDLSNCTGDLSNFTVDGTNTVGYRNIPQVSRSTAYALSLADAGKHILHPSADTTARVFTIPSNAGVAFPIGTAVTFVNQNAAGVVTIAITTDVMRLAGAGTTGSRTLAANGVATAIKLTATEWIISGSGLT